MSAIVEDVVIKQGLDRRIIDNGSLDEELTEQLEEGLKKHFKHKFINGWSFAEFKYNNLYFNTVIKNNQIMSYTKRFRDLWFPVDISQKFLGENYTPFDSLPGKGMVIGKKEEDYDYKNKKDEGLKLTVFVHKDVDFTCLIMRIPLGTEEAKQYLI